MSKVRVTIDIEVSDDFDINEVMAEMDYEFSYYDVTDDSELTGNAVTNTEIIDWEILI